MEHPLTDNWFVLRDLTRPNAKRPAYRLLEEKGIEVFTPMRWQLVERKGKRIREEVPLLHDLLFAHTTCACMDPIVEEISTGQLIFSGENSFQVRKLSRTLRYGK